MINRRNATLGLTAAATALVNAPASAQPIAAQEGRHYRKLPQRLSGTPGKIEVVEFFWYGCPHCNEFEPYLEAWIKKLPKNVEFRPVHIFIREVSRPHQRLSHTLLAMGVESRMRGAIFKAIHEQGNPLDTPEVMLKLLAPLGVDSAKFMSTYNSFGVNARINSANQLAAAYGVNGVPELGIGGLYTTAPSTVSGGQRMSAEESSRLTLLVADQLIAKLSKG